MNKLVIADPSFLPPSPMLPLPQKDQPMPKPKRKKIKIQDLANIDMDNLDEELALLGYNVDAVPMEQTPPQRKTSGLELQIIRTNEEARRMKEPMYDEDGCPILPDGSNRLFTLPELIALSQQNARLSYNPSKKKQDPKKLKLRKNPPPRKVDIEAMFREEAERQRRMAEYD